MLGLCRGSAAMSLSSQAFSSTCPAVACLGAFANSTKMLQSSAEVGKHGVDEEVSLLQMGLWSDLQWLPFFLPLQFESCMGITLIKPCLFGSTCLLQRISELCPPFHIQPAERATSSHVLSKKHKVPNAEEWLSNAPCP